MTKNEFDRLKEILEHACYEAYLRGMEDIMYGEKKLKDPEHFKIQGGAELLLRRELNRR